MFFGFWFLSIILDVRRCRRASEESFIVTLFVEFEEAGEDFVAEVVGPVTGSGASS